MDYEHEHAASVAETDAQHTELVEKIQKLNLLHESNTTLQADSEAHAKQSCELNGKLKVVLHKLNPLCDEHTTQLEENNCRWQEHNNQLLTKYDHGDPNEFQSLKDELKNLRTEKSAMETQQMAQAEELAQVQDEGQDF
ncbi:hypothetical protein EI94DRAFT_1812273 [Lactarius quietus]|nr:hypothetical protein EI94DRAFT_1812273 [Lactarius quietus]